MIARRRSAAELQILRRSADSTDVIASAPVLSIPEICEPARCALEHAVSLARRRAQERTGYDEQLSQFLFQYWTEADARMSIIERTLEIIRAIAPASRIQSVFRAAAECQNARVRSKAVLVLGTAIDSVPLVQRFLADHDGRVRANAIEVLWGRNPAEVGPIFNKAISDLHHRVAANALCGLYAVDQARCLSRIEAFATHMHPRFRSAAAWVIGKLGDRRNVPLLKALLVDKNADVRRSASRAVGILRGAALGGAV